MMTWICPTNWMMKSMASQLEDALFSCRYSYNRRNLTWTDPTYGIEFEAISPSRYGELFAMWPCRYGELEGWSTSASRLVRDP